MWIPVLFGAENPKPWDATLPPPELKVPAGFCSPKDELANPPKVLAPLFPNRLEVSGGTRTHVRGFGGRKALLIPSSWVSGDGVQRQPGICGALWTVWTLTLSLSALWHQGSGLPGSVAGGTLGALRHRRSPRASGSEEGLLFLCEEQLRAPPDQGK